MEKFRLNRALSKTTFVRFYSWKRDWTEMENREDGWDAGWCKTKVFPTVDFEYSLEVLMLTLKLHSFGHLMWRADSLEKTLMLGTIEGRGRRGQHGMRWLMASPTQWTWVWANSRRWWRTGKPGVPQFTVSQRIRHDLVTEQQQHLSDIWSESLSHPSLLKTPSPPSSC